VKIAGLRTGSKARTDGITAPGILTISQEMYAGILIYARKEGGYHFRGLAAGFPSGFRS